MQGIGIKAQLSRKQGKVLFMDNKTKYVLNDDGSITISRFYADNAKLEIPREMDGHRVTAIEDTSLMGLF